MPSYGTFERTVAQLQQFWQQYDCTVLQPYDMPMGAGTFHPACFFGTLKDQNFSACYVQPSRRPTDGRYGQNPNRLGQYYQFQVLLKPAPDHIQQLYLKSLDALGLKTAQNDIRFLEDDWGNPTLGAYGVGWEVWCNGMEITQFTYFQRLASLPLKVIPVEITYGLERLCLYLQGKDNVFDIKWNDRLTYGELFARNEQEMSCFHFEKADTERLEKIFHHHKEMATSLILEALLLPAYDSFIAINACFNLLDARGVLSVVRRADMIQEIRSIASSIAGGMGKVNTVREGV